MELSFVIPACNEQENLHLVINNILDLMEEKDWWYEIIIVNDNSTDNTGLIADEFTHKFDKIKVVHRTGRENGIGLTLEEGTSIAKGNIVIWTMADGSDDLKAIPLMIEKIRNGYNMVIASRVISPFQLRGFEIVRYIVRRLHFYIWKGLFKIPVNDITNAFRVFKKSVFEIISLESKGFGISTEYTTKAYLQGFEIGEVLTDYRNRSKGRSKFNILKTLIEIIRLSKYKFIDYK